RPARGASRDLDSEARGERLDGLGEVQPVDLAHEVDDVASRTATEAVVEALVAVDREGRRALVVERAEALPGPAGLLQAGVLADDLDDVGRRTQLREDVVVDVEVAHRSSTIVAPLPPSRASAWRIEATAGWRRRCSRRPSRRRPVPWPWTTR